MARAPRTPTGKRELTPADALATVRVIENHLTIGERVDSGVISPDGKRYLLRLVHGDVERNGVWMDLLTGSLDSLRICRPPETLRSSIHHRFRLHDQRPLIRSRR